MIPGETSTGSKRHDMLFGRHPGPRRMVRAAGCRVWDDEGREYLDTVMALGAVALGYADPDVTAAAEQAARDGTVGPLPPVAEADLAERLLEWVPGAAAVRFLKTGAEGVAAAVRLARTATGRERVIRCGYHGWLDWCQVEPGVPHAVRRLATEVPFNDLAALASAADGDLPPAALVVEPVVDDPPDAEWVQAVNDTAVRLNAVLVLDEVKTGIRLGPGGAAARYGYRPDLVVLGKALGNGYPIAAVAGSVDVMDAATRTWISSTLATEGVALAAGKAVLEAFERRDAARRLTAAGERFRTSLHAVASRHPQLAATVRGIPEFCYLSFQDGDLSAAVASRAAARGLLFKRNAYNFVALAHDTATLEMIEARLDAALTDVEQWC